MALETGAKPISIQPMPKAIHGARRTSAPAAIANASKAATPAGSLQSEICVTGVIT